MAIFRGGKRVGPFDIRMGFPRDRSLDNVDSDPRLFKPRNTENTIGRFMGAMSRAEGYARPARFAVRIFLPSNLENVLKAQHREKYAEGQKISDEQGFGIQYPAMGTELRQMQIHCDSVTMPGHDLITETVEHFGPTRDYVTGHGFTGNIVASFYADKYLRERHFIEMWQKTAVGMTNHKAGYYKDYTGKMHIYQLGQIENGDHTRDVPTYGIEAIEVYPETISAVEYNYGSSNQIVKINVNFHYKEWYNLATDKIAGVNFGSAVQQLPDQPTGMGGIFSRLPPELKRAGRDVLNQARTRFPVGKIFKGKVFPPYT